MPTVFEGPANSFFRTLNQKLEPPVREHLKQVYISLALATLAAAVGSYIHIFTDFMAGGLMSGLGAAGFAIALSVSHDDGKNTQKRLSYLMGFAGCTGLSMGPLLEMAIYLNPKIVPMALISTCLVFASFSLSSIFSTHRKWLYLGGGLISMLSVMLFMSIINLFIGSYYLYQANLYLGLFLFCIFIMYDTANIIEKRRMGDTDYLKHAMVLFIDFVDIFKRLVVLLMQKERNNGNNRNNRSQRNYY